MHAEVTHEPHRGRFIVRTGEQESRLVYRLVHPGLVDFRSTFVHPSVRGQGVGEVLVCRALEWAHAQGLRVIPSCWFVETVVRRHPEFEAMLER